MNKPISIAIKETKEKIILICNESELPITILDLIMQGICGEIRNLADKQTLEEEKRYAESLETMNQK